MTSRQAHTLYVNELFSSIQGESTRAGLPCGFIRLAGCNLRCAWCDTSHAFEDGRDMTVPEILAAVQQWELPLVEITGGEPLVQPGCVSLARALLAAGYTTLVETNGSLPVAVLPEKVIRILDIKCPGSGMNDKMHWPNIEALTARDEVKFVLAHRADYDYALQTMRQYALADRGIAVLLSPVPNRLDAQQLAAWMLEDSVSARLQLQLHKQIWPPDMRCV